MFIRLPTGICQWSEEETFEFLAIFDIGVRWPAREADRSARALMKSRRTQAARSHATRDQITQAATAVFALKGYAAASMEDVALAAGCSKGGLYHHFPSRELLLRAVAERMAAEGTLTPSADSPTAATPAAKLLLEIWAEATRDHALRTQIASAYDAVAGPAGHAGRIDELLAIGRLVQELTRPADDDVGAAVARLAQRRAA